MRASSSVFDERPAQRALPIGDVVGALSDRLEQVERELGLSGRFGVDATRDGRSRPNAVESAPTSRLGDGGSPTPRSRPGAEPAEPRDKTPRCAS
jgi:hypothetical protein